MSKDHAGPICGIVFFVLAFVGIVVIGGKTPETSEDSVREIVSYYRDEEGTIIANGILQTVGGTLLIFFGASLRGVLRKAEGSAGVLSAAAFAGTIILGVALALDGAISFALADTIDKLQPAAAQALHALYNYDFLVFGLGTQLFLLGLGLSLARHGVLPKWLGWVAIVFGVVAVTPVGIASALVAALLVLIISVMLLMRGRSTPQAA